MSPQAKISDNVTYEWTIASILNVPIIPLMLCTDKEIELHAYLKTIQYLDFTHSNPDEMPWYDLIEQLQKLLNQYSQTSIKVARDAPLAVHNAVAMLDSPNAENRLMGLESLANSRYEQKDELLLEAIKCTVYDDVHLQAAINFANITDYSDERAIPPLIDHLGKENPTVRNNTIATLTKMGDLAVIPLINCLHDGDKNIRHKAALILRKIGGERAIAPALVCLNDKDSDIRKLAVQILGKFGDERAVIPLIDCLDDEDSSVRYIVSIELGKIGDPAVLPLIECLDNNNQNVRQNAAKILKQIGTREGIVALRQKDMY